MNDHGTHAGFRSLLWPTGSPAEATEPQVLEDLALEGMIASLDPSALPDVWRRPLRARSDVDARQEVFRDLGRSEVRSAVDRFLTAWESAASALDRLERSRDDVERTLWAVEVASRRAASIEHLHRDLSDAQPASGLLRDLVELLGQTVGREDWLDRTAAAVALLDRVGRISVDVLVQGGKVTVAHFDEEPDLESGVLDTFARFRRGDAEDYCSELPDPTELDHVQAWILDLVAHEHPELAADLGAFASAGTGIDERLEHLAGEIGFYLGAMTVFDGLRGTGLEADLPRFAVGADRLRAERTWDLALAVRLVEHGERVVTNDLRLEGGERILVVSGPNQGGKTTTARTFGQLHHLAALGVPVPGRGVELRLPDRVATLFDREESLENPEGRLGSELDRVHDMLDRATDRTVVVMNEAYSSTSLQDARELTQATLDRLIEIDATVICVTFIDEMSRLGPATVSMTSLVDPDDPARRTFRVERREADGLASVRALAERHGLTAERIAERLESVR